MSNLDDAKAWLVYAQRDYDIALHLSITFRPLPVENICYGCQQAIEKALKSILIYHTGDAPKVHDIATLRKLCKEHTGKITLPHNIVRTLTRFATKSRYPDEVYDFTESDVELALKYSKQVLGKVTQFLEKTEQELGVSCQKDEQKCTSLAEKGILVGGKSSVMAEINKAREAARNKAREPANKTNPAPKKKKSDPER